MAPIQAAYQASPEWQEIEAKAYPPPVVHKKVKKPKDKGSRYPGGSKPQDETKATEPLETKTAELALS